ncbi:MAG: hypothetical protein OXU51_01510 [Candidatus Poribacteria bacterium]|nr:hypothetical protein [Candidatus Poribacteria bacterium]
MLDFQEWKAVSKVEIDLNQLSYTTSNLDSDDHETNEPASNPQEIDFYLPNPIKDRAVSQFAKLRTDQEESMNQSVDGLDQVIEKRSSVELKSSVILDAVVTEILQNHHPHSDYKVRISDG